MLKEDVYIKSAEYFGTSVGVAHKISTHTIKVIDEVSFKKYDEEDIINSIVKKAIASNQYQTLQRWIYKVDIDRGKRKMKQSTIYKKAWDIINGNERNKSKSGKILKVAV
jgi:hypothetical protein